MRKQETLTKNPHPMLTWGGGGKIDNLAKKSGSKKILKAIATLFTGGLLAVAMPMANADTFTFGSGLELDGVGAVTISGATIEAAVLLGDDDDSTNTGYRDGSAWVPVPGDPNGPGNVYNLKSLPIDITVDSAVSGGFATAVLATDLAANSVFDFGSNNVKIQGAGQIRGFAIGDAAGFAAGTFLGTINAGNATIDVESADGTVIGVRFSGTGGIGAGSNVTFGDITVKTGQGGDWGVQQAFGFIVNTIADEGSVSLGNIKATGDVAAGASVAGNLLGELTVKDIETYGTGVAGGQLVEGNIGATGVLKTGDIFAEAKHNDLARAYGVEVREGILFGGTLETGAIEVVAKTTVPNAYASPIAVGTIAGSFSANSQTPPTPNDVVGTVLVDGDVFATASGKGAIAAGHVMNNLASGAEFTTKGNIDAVAKGEESDAAGYMLTGNLVGKLTTENISVRAEREAAGVRVGVGASTGNITGVLTTGDIDVVATGDAGAAIGIHAIGGFNPIGDSAIGTIGVYSANTTGANDGAAGQTVAAGIWAGENSSFVLTNGIYVGAEESAGNGTETTNAYGVLVEGNATITIADDLDIFVYGADKNVGIAAEDLTLIIEEKVWASISGVNVKTLGLSGEANSIVDLGALYASEKTTVFEKDGNGDGKFFVAIDLGAGDFGDDFIESPLGRNIADPTGLSEIKADVHVFAYGEVYEGEENGRAFAFGKGIDESADLTNFAVFTEWEMLKEVDGEKANMIRSNGARAQAQINDGFLAAFSMHNNYTVWNAVRDRMITGSGARYNGLFRGQACDPCAPVGPCDEIACDPCDPCATFGGGRGFRGFGLGRNGANGNRDLWVNYTGRSNTYESVLNKSDWNTSVEGIQGGTDLFRSKRSQFGVIFGYEGGRSRNEADRIESENTYMGFYGARVLRGGADVRFATGFGWQDYDMNRFGRDDLLYTSSFKGNTIDLNVEFGKRFGRGAWTVRPAAGFDLAYNKLKGATEAGEGLEAVSYDSTKLTRTFLRFGSDLRYQVRNFTLNSGAYYAHNVNNDKLSTNVTSIEYGLRPGLAGSNIGRSLLMANVGGDFQVTRNLGLFLGYEGQFGLDGTKTSQNTGYLGGVVKW